MVAALKVQTDNYVFPLWLRMVVLVDEVDKI